MRKLSWVLLALLALIGCGDPTKNVVVRLESPLTVKRGDEFVIVVSVENISSKQQTLVSLDIADAYIHQLNEISSSEFSIDHF